MAKKDRLAKIEDALVKSYGMCPEIEPDSVWSMRVMTQVRQERVWAVDNDSVVSQRFVWRFAIVACTFAFVILVYAFSLEIRPEQLTMKLFIDDPLNAVTMRVFAL